MSVRTRMSPVGARDGFTLMEVIVALVISSLALGAGFATLSFVGERAVAAEAATVQALEGSAGRMLLVDWLAGARLSAPNRGGSFLGLDAEENGLDNDEIIFPTTSRTPLHVPNAVVRLYVDEDEETPERGLVAELTERLLDEPRRVELLPQVAAMELRYLPDVEGGVEDVEWEVSWGGRNSLPKAVELVLFAVPGDSLPPLLRYPIRVPLGTLR